MLFDVTKAVTAAMRAAQIVGDRRAWAGKCRWFRSGALRALQFRNGTPVATVQEAALSIMHSIHSSDAVRDAIGEERSFVILAEPPQLIEPGTGKKQPLFMRAQFGDAEQLALLKKTRVRKDAVIEVAEVPLAVGELGAHRYAFGQTRIEEGELTLMATESADGQQRFTVRHPRHAEARTMDPPRPPAVEPPPTP